jgi:hypothetical protein
MKSRGYEILIHLTGQCEVIDSVSLAKGDAVYATYETRLNETHPRFAYQPIDDDGSSSSSVAEGLQITGFEIESS